MRVGRKFLLAILVVMLNLIFFINVSAETDINADNDVINVSAETDINANTNVINDVNTETNVNDIERIIKVDIDGKLVDFNYETGYPFLDENERTLVPFRAAMEAYGCEVSWDAERFVAIAKKGDTIVEVPVQQNYIKRNGFEILMDTNTVLKNSRVYLPIRAVVEAFGAEVSWNQYAETVIINSLGAEIELVKVHFIDVGHGDSIFIDYGNYEVLIDAGITSTGAVVSDYIKPYVDENLDLLIVTHSHKDHVGGLPKIFQDYQIDRVIDNGSSLDTEEWRAYEEALTNEENCIVSYDEDENIDISEDVQLSIIEVLDGQSNENNNSVVVLLKYKDVSMLFTGDSQAEAETIIAQKVGKVDVFKGSHHGSYNANSKVLLDVIKPQYIVISAGKGINYTHPHASALKRMFNAGATVYGTFKSGTVVMKIDGISYSFETAANGEETNAKPLIPLQLIDAGTYQNNIDHF